MINIIVIVVSIPIFLLFGYLTKKVSLTKLLITTYLGVIVGGIFVIHFTLHAGSDWKFTMGYIISQTLDVSNFVITQTMI